MQSTLFFYDLETSGLNPKEHRIMQFAGQRTDLQLNPIGDPFNIIIKLTDDVLPDPGAILITGITPQQTISDGITEAEFLKIFYAEIATEGTIFAGFNTIRFDDEFMRYTMYRNFYDPYEWQWQDKRSRWDLLDVVRMTRALRPDGINWPVDSTGAPTNRLELLTKSNSLDHRSARDALSDVWATIAVAQLIKDKQPKLFDYLLNLRNKSAVERVVSTKQPFVYSSGRYSNESQKTTLAVAICEHPKSGYLIYDLAHDPEIFKNMSVSDLRKSLTLKRGEPGPRLPVKTLKPNRCPAVAPMNVLDESSETRINLTKEQALKNFKLLQKNLGDFSDKVQRVFGQLDQAREKKYQNVVDTADGRLYDAFLKSADKSAMSMVRASTAEEVTALDVKFQDDRLNELFTLYKARNFSSTLSDEDRAAWEKFREEKLLGGGNESRAAKFFASLASYAQSQVNEQSKQFILEELQLYGQSIMPVVDLIE